MEHSKRRKEEIERGTVRGEGVGRRGKEREGGNQQYYTHITFTSHIYSAPSSRLDSTPLYSTLLLSSQRMGGCVSKPPGCRNGCGRDRSAHADTYCIELGSCPHE